MGLGSWVIVTAMLESWRQKQGMTYLFMLQAICK